MNTEASFACFNLSACSYLPLTTDLPQVLLVVFPHCFFIKLSRTFYANIFQE